MQGSRERVLITGGNGFLGAYLARNLIETGHEVHLLLRGGSDRWRLAGLHGRYTVHEGDLLNVFALRSIIATARPQVIYHAAANGVYAYQKDRSVMLNTNVIGTANLLDALEGHDYQMLVNLGSSAEYGHKTGATFESDRLDPVTDYGVAKAAASLLCQAAALKGKPVTTVRIFCAYGPGDTPARLVPHVMDCCLKGERPKVSAGWQPRDFIYIEDVIDLLKVAAATPAARGQILHAANGHEWKVRDMVETITEVCSGGKLQAEYGAAAVRPDEPTTWYADIARTVALTGWKPKVDLRTGVARTWDWFQASALKKVA